MNQLLSTKTQIPQSFGNLIERTRLLQLLDHSLAVPVTLVAAPAGFGKTTLVCQWLTQIQSTVTPSPHVGWLSCDALDSSLDVFLAYFITAIRSVYPDACPDTMHMLAGSLLLSEDALVYSLVNEIDRLAQREADAGCARLVLVLDDYDSIRGSAVNNLITALLKYPPRCLHLIFTCRRDPALPLARWRTQNLLLELRSKDLRLTRSEIAEFLACAVPIEWSDAQIAALDEKTEGWAAGLHLISLAVHEQAKADRIVAELNTPQLHVMNYLMEEVMVQLPQELQTHILQLSILERFNAELCEQVCDTPGESGTEFLARLRKANLFVVGLDAAGTWYRFQHLFQQLLQYQLKHKAGPKERAALHTRAMRWFAKYNFIEEALGHAFSAGEFAAAVDLVAENRHRLMNQEQWHRLASWLEMFSNELVSWSPDLLLTKAWLARSLNFDLTVTHALVHQAAALLATHELPPRRLALLRAEINALGTIEAYRLANPGRAILLGARALDTLPVDCYMVRSLVYLQYAAAYQMQGDLQRATAILQQAQTEEVMSGQLARARASGGMAMLAWMAGDLSGVLEQGKNMLTNAEANELHDSVTWGRYFIAAASYERNDLTRAEENAAAGLLDPNPSGNFRATVDSAIILAWVYQARNVPDSAREVLDDALGWTLEKHSEILARVLRAAQAELALAQGDTGTAIRWLASLDIPLTFGAMPNFSSPLLTVPGVLIAQNTHETRRRACEVLAQLEAHLSAIHNTRFLIDVLVLQAQLSYLEGDQSGAMTALQRAVDLAEPGGFIRPFLDPGAPVQKLLALLLEKLGTHPYVKGILQAFPVLRPVPGLAQPSPLIEPLTGRESIVLQLLEKRLSNKEIAQELIISPLTVKAHTDHIYQKLGVNSRRDAVRVALALGLLDSSL